LGQPERFGVKIILCVIQPAPSSRSSAGAMIDDVEDLEVVALHLVGQVHNLIGVVLEKYGVTMSRNIHDFMYTEW
ncbi:hypothetical protein, partial [Lysinibacillus capsici]|uniref:hypothetical protein n=1 Tax=Lysinibacillus capsici TaxID=2115968 RepID=UPI002A82E600